MEDFRISGCLNPNYHPVPLSKQIKDAWQAYTQEANPQAFEQLSVDFHQSVSGLMSDTPKPTAFQLAILHKLQTVAFGRVQTYGQLALQIGKPVGASRAVGGALAQNPVPLVVPCHRIVSQSGVMTNFCGSVKFVEIKQFLLAWENAIGALSLMKTD
jgi:O-6-methylguanine DNA methyltransferase